MAWETIRRASRSAQSTDNCIDPSIPRPPAADTKASVKTGLQYYFGAFGPNVALDEVIKQVATGHHLPKLLGRRGPCSSCAPSTVSSDCTPDGSGVDVDRMPDGMLELGL